MKLERYLNKQGRQGQTEPVIFNLRTPADRRKLQRLIGGSKSIEVVDTYGEQVRELYLTRHPRLRVNLAQAAKQAAASVVAQSKSAPLWQQGRWVYFPWQRRLVHLLSHNEFYELRSSRNHNLITVKEQAALRSVRIAVIGLSVGNSVALDLALEGAEHLWLVDFDELGLSNLNRIRSGVQDLGLNKVIIAARQIYELNPYADLKLFPGGLTEQLLQRVVSGVDLIIDEMDDVVMKLRLREAARRKRVAVVSAADNGDSAIIDVQRFDQRRNLAIYHGDLPTTDPDEVRAMGFAQRLELINAMVGFRFVTARMRASLSQVGKTLYAWPQLGGAAQYSGSILAYVVRRILAGQPMPSGKYDCNLDRFLIPGYDAVRQRRLRHKKPKVL